MISRRWLRRTLLTLTAAAVVHGILLNLETWQREGYADYVGKGGAFDFGPSARPQGDDERRFAKVNVARYAGFFRTRTVLARES